MQQYEYSDQYRGKPRRLLILKPDDGSDCRVFCEGAFIGSMRLIVHPEASDSWQTDYNTLKPIVTAIGKFIGEQVKLN